MSSSRPVLLDPNKDNIPPPGHTVVCDPVAFVEHALENEPLLVQGEDLCRWAEDFGVGRGWHTTWLRSPVHELHQLCPNLSPDEADSIIKELAGHLGNLRRPLQLTDVLEALWGGDTLWATGPDDDHAFRWLTWLAQQPADGPKMKLLSQQARSWQASAAPPLQRAYSVCSGADAWSLLKEWLGVVQPQQTWPAPPQVTLPGSLLRRLQEDLTKEAVETDTDCFAGLLDRAPKRTLLCIAAQECAKVLLADPQKATAERVRRLASYLPYDLAQDLNSLVKLEYPGLPQWKFDELKDWFTAKYLPYRDWESRAGATSNRGKWASASGEQFARQYLQYYVVARVGGEGAEHLAWVKSLRLRSCGDCVYLLVVLDGLAYPDAVRLTSSIDQESRRLFLDEQTLALAPLPTVTDFAKPAVAKGMLPVEALQDATRMIYTSGDEVARALLKAAPGDVLVWTLQEPDRAYHFRADTGPVSVRHEVDAQLSSVAKHIASIAEKAPAYLKLRVVITTDHGRLLTRAERTLSIPPGMTAHGRAAWGSCDVPFDESGCFIDEGIAYLHPVRFGLPEGQGYAVIVSDKAFLTADERGGNEPFPHGGLFPEEVLIPWFEFTRDRGPVRIEVTLEGKGEEGKAGRAALTVRNLGPIPITVIGLTVEKLGTRIDLHDEVRTLEKKRLDITLPKWPSRQELQNLTMCLTYLLPDAQHARCEFSPEIQTESLYDRPDILGELGGL